MTSHPTAFHPPGRIGRGRRPDGGLGFQTRIPRLGSPPEGQTQSRLNRKILALPPESVNVADHLSQPGAPNGGLGRSQEIDADRINVRKHEGSVRQGPLPSFVEAVFPSFLRFPAAAPSNRRRERQGTLTAPKSSGTRTPIRIKGHEHQHCDNSKVLHAPGSGRTARHHAGEDRNAPAQRRPSRISRRPPQAASNSRSRRDGCGENPPTGASGTTRSAEHGGPRSQARIRPAAEAWSPPFVEFVFSRHTSENNSHPSTSRSPLLAVAFVEQIPRDETADQARRGAPAQPVGPRVVLERADPGPAHDNRPAVGHGSPGAGGGGCRDLRAGRYSSITVQRRSGGSVFVCRGSFSVRPHAAERGSQPGFPPSR